MGSVKYRSVHLRERFRTAAIFCVKRKMKLKTQGWIRVSLSGNSLTHFLHPPTPTHTLHINQRTGVTHSLLQFCNFPVSTVYQDDFCLCIIFSFPLRHFPTCITRCLETAAGFWGPLTTSIWSALKGQWQVSGPQVENWQPSISRRCYEPVQHRRLKWPVLFITGCKPGIRPATVPVASPPNATSF